MFALDAQALLVGRTDRCDHPSEANQVPSIGTLFPPQFERILSRTPTDVLMIDGHLGLKAQLRKLGVRVHEIQPHSLSEIFSQVGDLGDLLGQSKKAHAWLTQARARIKSLQVPKRRPKVFVEIWNAPLTAAGSKSFMGDLVSVAGGDIYPKNLGAWPTVSLERLITYNPEVILVSTKALYHELLTSPTKPWRAVKAVQTRQIHLLEGRLTRPGPRIIDDVVWLNQLLSHTRQTE
jgi:iron complex transport system substrate-binding protein